MFIKEVFDYTMDYFTTILFIVLFCIKGVACEEDGLTGLIVAGTLSGVFLCCVIVMAVVFSLWKDAFNRHQLQKGKIKVPRSWLDKERLAKLAKKQQIKQQLKEHLRQKQMEKAKQNAAIDMEMQYMHRSRPQIPGSWRREVRHQNGYIVQEIPTLQRNVLVDNNHLVSVVDNDRAVWHRSQDPTGLRYTQLSYPSTVVPISPRNDPDSSSSSGSSESTLKIIDKKRSKKAQRHDDTVIEATLDFTNDDDIPDDMELQERATAF